MSKFVFSCLKVAAFDLVLKVQTRSGSGKGVI